MLLIHQQTGTFVGCKHLVLRLRRTERVKLSCKSDITSDVTERYYSLGLSRSDSSTGGEYAATKTSIVVVVVTTLHHRHLHHILSPFHVHCTHPRPPNGRRPPPSVVTLSHGRCELALIATLDVAAVLVVDAVVVDVASAAAALRCHPHRPLLFAVVVATVAVVMNRHAT